MLTFSPEEVSNQYPAFFKRYPIKPEATAIGSIFKQNFDVAKKKLRDFFPFGEDGRMLMASYNDNTFIASNAFPSTLSLLCIARLHGEHCETAEILENKKLDGAKFSRYILALYKNNECFEREIDNRLTRYDACTELPLLPLAKKRDFETIVQNFYSELAKIKGTKVDMIFSVNPYDIANASNGGRFSSCNALGSQHENAPICAAASPTMAIIKLENAGTKELLGRCYVSVSTDFKSFVVQPTYGFMKDDFVADAEKWMCAFINAKLGDTDQPWYKHKNLETVHPSYVSGCKLANFYVDNSASVYNRKDYGDLPAIRLGDCHCLVCGELSLHLICVKCRADNFSKCRNCRTYIDKTTDLCESCAGRRKICADCGEEFFADAMVTLCGDCSTIHTRCLICGHDCDFNIAGASNTAPLLDGLFYAHINCLEDKPRRTCRFCGKPVSGYNYACAYCASVTEGKNHASRVIREIKSFRKRLSWESAPADISVGAHMLLPTPHVNTYAIAA